MVEDKSNADEPNVFLSLAKAMWARGEDGEVLARELAKAFEFIVIEGEGEEASVPQALERFLSGG